MNDTTLILHVKGTADQTTELPKSAVRAGIAQGQISRSQLIWSPAHNEWKQVRELTHLLPSQKIAPAPKPRILTGALPRVTSSGPVPKGAADEGAAPTPTPRVAVKAKARAQAAVPVQAAQVSHVVHEEQGVDVVKWICLGLGLVILAAVGINVLLVDLPLTRSLGKTSFAGVSVYAHLGAFVQPNAMVVHIPATPKVTPDNLVDFLTALAKSTPEAPLTQEPFERISLTSGFFGGYSISGESWKQLGRMSDDSASDRRMFLLNSLCTGTGAPLVDNNPNLKPDVQLAQNDKAWDAFVAYFAK